MDDTKDQFDALMKLAEFKRRDQRRQFEWKFTATALIALSGLALFPKDAKLWLIVLGVVLVCLVHTAWVYWNMLSNERDRADMYHYKDAAERLLRGGQVADVERRPKLPLPLFRQPACLFPIFTAYGVGLFAIAVRYFSN